MENIAKNLNYLITAIPIILAVTNFVIRKRYFFNYFIDLLSAIVLLISLNIFTLTFPFIFFISNEQYKKSEVVYSVLIALFFIVLVLMIEVSYIRRVKNNFTLFKVSNTKGILLGKKNKKDKIKIKYIDEAQINYSYKHLAYNITKEISIYDKEKYVEKFYYTDNMYEKMKNKKNWKIFLVFRILLIITSLILWIIFKFSVLSMISSYVCILFLIVKNAILIPAIQKENRLEIEKALKNFK